MELNIIEFSTKNNNYVFDGNTSRIFLMDKYFEHILKCLQSEVKSVDEICKESEQDLDKEALKQRCQYVNQLIDRGCFYKREITGNKKVYIKEEIYNTPNMALILVLTGSCNLRCKYCVYGEYYPNEITYSDIEDISLDTIQKAIDEYITLYKDKERHGYFKIPSIFFYGGEPLLKKDLIKYTINYIKEKKFECNFYMTTNGLFLDEEFSEFCVKNHFTITFSLDGYKNNHDRNRVTEKNNPTFDVVYNNIVNYEKIKRKYNNKEITSFNCCYDDYTDIEKCVDFFIENAELFMPMYVVYSYINPYETDYYKSLEKNCKQEKCFNKSYGKVYDKFVNGEYKSAVQKAATQNLFLGCSSLSMRNIGTNRSGLNNCCIPLTKLAVYPDGTYTICERMNKKMPIGNVNEGIDYIKIQEIMDAMVYELNEGRCRDCTVKNLCNACYQFVNTSCQIKEEFCRNEKNTIINRLIQYCDILEKNPLAFEGTIMSEEERKLLKILG